MMEEEMFILWISQDPVIVWIWKSDEWKEFEMERKKFFLKKVWSEGLSWGWMIKMVKDDRCEQLMDLYIKKRCYNNCISLFNILIMFLFLYLFFLFSSSLLFFFFSQKSKILPPTSTFQLHSFVRLLFKSYLKLSRSNYFKIPSPDHQFILSIVSLFSFFF
jgi:hypothetical protein